MFHYIFLNPPQPTPHYPIISTTWRNRNPQNIHCRAGRPPRIMKTGAGRAGGTSGFYGVAYRSRSARRAPQMASIGRLGSSALAGRVLCARSPTIFTANIHCRAGRPPRIMKTGAGRAGGTSGFYGVAYRSRSARRAPQMASIGRLGSSALAGRGFVRPIPNHFHGKSTPTVQVGSNASSASPCAAKRPPLGPVDGLTQERVQGFPCEVSIGVQS